MNVQPIHHLAKTCCFAAAFLSISVDTLAQDCGLPILNTAGRFLGVGYSRGGYHSPAAGQLQATRHSPHAHAYRSSYLQYPYSPEYTPHRPAHAYPRGLPANQHTHSIQRNPNTMGTATPSVPPIQVHSGNQAHADRPAVPPPAWLQPMLKDEQPKSSTEAIERPQAVEDGADDLLRSPSDLKGNSEQNDDKDPFGFDASPQTESSPSDRSGDSLLDLPASSDQLLDPKEDEDDLLLLNGDLSRQRGLRVTPVSILERTPVRNRYR